MNDMIKKFVGNSINRILVKLPWRSIRRIYNASLYGIINGKSNLTSEDIKLINEEMGLSKEYENLTVPIELGELIWGNEILNAPIQLKDRVIKLSHIDPPGLTDEEIKVVVDWLYGHLKNPIRKRLTESNKSTLFKQEIGQVLHISFRVDHFHH